MQNNKKKTILTQPKKAARIVFPERSTAALVRASWVQACLSAGYIVSEREHAWVRDEDGGEGGSAHGGHARKRPRDDGLAVHDALIRDMLLAEEVAAAASDDGGDEDEDEEPQTQFIEAVARRFHDAAVLRRELGAFLVGGAAAAGAALAAVRGAAAGEEEGSLPHPGYVARAVFGRERAEGAGEAVELLLGCAAAGEGGGVEEAAAALPSSVVQGPPAALRAFAVFLDCWDVVFRHTAVLPAAVAAAEGEGCGGEEEGAATAGATATATATGELATHRVFPALRCALNPATDWEAYSLFLAEAQELGGGGGGDGGGGGAEEDAGEGEAGLSEAPLLRKLPSDPFPRTTAAEVSSPPAPASTARQERRGGEGQAQFRVVPAVTGCLSVYSEGLSEGLVREAAAEGAPAKKAMWCALRAHGLVSVLRRGVPVGTPLFSTLKGALEEAVSVRRGDEGVVLLLCTVLLVGETAVRPPHLLDAALLRLQADEIEAEEVKLPQQAARLAAVRALHAEACAPVPVLRPLPGCRGAVPVPLPKCTLPHVTRHVLERPARCLPHYAYVLNLRIVAA